MSLLAKKSLGIDIGASSIKIVEVTSLGRKKKLENYVEFRLPLKLDSLRTFQEKTLLLVSGKVADILGALLKKAGIRQRKVAFALPDFSTFFTTFSLPPMGEEEIPQAIEFEARHHIPIPLSEVIFDWQIIEKEELESGVKLRVLLVAVPKKVLERYQDMATLCRLEVKGMEAEVFGVIRSSIPKDKMHKAVCVVDFGWQSTTVSIVEKGILKVSHSFDVSGTSLTKALSESLKVSLEEADEFKRKYGLDPGRPDISKVLTQQIDSLAMEIERVCGDFHRSDKKKVNDIILVGGTANLFGLREYFETRLKKNVQIADPFSSVSFPPILRSRLKEIGPSFAVALGVGLMGLEA